MDAQQICDVVRDVFGRNYPTKIIGGWVSMPCPLATWLHPNQRDSRPSAGVSINKTGTSIFSCFTCHGARPFHAMLQRYADFTGEDLDDIIEELEEEAYLGPRNLPDWDQLKDDAQAVLMPLDKAVYLDLYDSAAGHWYLEDRGISAETAKLLQLKVDPEDPVDGHERILFPVFGLDGELYGFSGRDVTGRAKLKVRDYQGLSKGANLLGAHLFAGGEYDKILVVEGLFDVANSWEQGYPAVAAMHSTLTAAQADILRNINLPTYLFYDNDAAGQNGVEIAGRQLAQYQPVMRVDYPRIKVEDNSARGWHLVKDPGELIADEFEEMIKNCRLF